MSSRLPGGNPRKYKGLRRIATAEQCPIYLAQSAILKLRVEEKEILRGRPERAPFSLCAGRAVGRFQSGRVSYQGACGGKDHGS
jgi:hypothetical protein